jgi:hypothetical protein
VGEFLTLYGSLRTQYTCKDFKKRIIPYYDGRKETWVLVQIHALVSVIFCCFPTKQRLYVAQNRQNTLLEARVFL